MTFGSSMSYEASYVKARKKAVKQLKNSNAQQLEIETKKMEDRIRALKEQMFREKEEREKQGGTRWASGKSGPLSTHAQDVLKKKSSKAEKPQRRIKVLGDEPLQSYKKKATPRVQQPDNIGSLGCGQCEKTKATVVCVECAEKYCVSCFMSFHQKGALKKHNTQTIEQYEAGQLEEKDTKSVNYSKPELSPSKKVNRVTSQGQAKSPQFGDTTGHQGGSLLEGSYNEEESAQSFAQALMEWRNAGKQEKLWTNPTDTKSNTCETSTTPEPPKAQEVKLTFGPNKSLSYLDRMLLKKHHGDPKFLSNDVKSKGIKSKSPNSSSQIEIENQLGTNYREIFQSLGASNRKHAQKNSAENLTTSKGVVLIQEVNDDDLSMEETTACIIEEEDSYPHPQPQSTAIPHSGRVSIMCMTPRGDFEADTEALVLQDVSPVSNTSPALKPSSPMSRLGVRGANSQMGQNIAKRLQIKDQSDGLARVWSPQPSHVGLSEFFLAGVKDDLPSGRQSRERVTAFGPTSVKPDKLSKTLLSQHVWKPHESIIENADIQQQMQEGNDNGSEVHPESPRPIIPLLREPSLSAKRRDSPDSSSSTIGMPVATDIQYDTQIHDFGIVDFLKSQPNGYEDYSLVHRVSTVTDFTLSPNPPVFHWSDDSDDDFLEHVCSRVNQDEQRADQEEADRATLTDLAWELASTTGRLTQCDLDEEEEDDDDNGEDGEGKRKEEGGIEGEFDEDSIETNDLGSGLSSSDEETPVDSYSANVNRPKESDEDALAEAEVHALK